MKYLLITLEVQDGERRHTHRILHTTNAKDIQFAAQRYAASFWGYGEHQDEWWWVNGEFAIRVKLVKELSEYEYRLMSELMSETITHTDFYFKIVHAGWNKDSQREEIQIHCGENGNLFLFQDDGKLGFICDVYGQTDHVSTMQVWEEDLADEDDAPENFSELELEEFKSNWGQTHVEICANLDYDIEDADDLLVDDYFWLETEKKWYPKCASTYSEREQAIADFLKL